MGVSGHSDIITHSSRGPGCVWDNLVASSHFNYFAIFYQILNVSPPLYVFLSDCRLHLTFTFFPFASPTFRIVLALMFLSLPILAQAM